MKSKERLPWLCHCCDAVIDQQQCTKLNDDITCLNCGCEIYSCTPVNYHLLAAISISSLILFIPAILLPILSIQFADNENYFSILTTIYELFSSFNIIIALLLTLLVIIMPVIRIFCAIFMSFIILFWHKKQNIFYLALRTFDLLKQWYMFDILLLAVLIANIKLRDFSHIHIHASGMICLIVYVLLELGLSKIINTNIIWRQFSKAIHDAKR